MSDLIDKTPQNKLFTNDAANSVEVHEEDSSPERGEYEEPPRSIVQDKETTRNLVSTFEKEDDDTDEPTAADIFKMMKSM
ncbi:hypothetical protein M5689_006647 [Euphorbia peplus]|nr:hypothetical protein M5689_006647 [Euphorbia peplus]